MVFMTPSVREGPILPTGREKSGRFPLPLGGGDKGEVGGVAFPSPKGEGIKGRGKGLVLHPASALHAPPC